MKHLSLRICITQMLSRFMVLFIIWLQPCIKTCLQDLEQRFLANSIPKRTILLGDDSYSTEYVSIIKKVSAAKMSSLLHIHNLENVSYSYIA